MCTNVQGGLFYTWKTEARGGSIYSIDKILIDFALAYRSSQSVLDGVAALVWVEFSHWTTYKMGTFRDQFSFTLSCDRSFWLGVGLNGPSGVDTSRARLEFNPNKVGQCRELRWVYNLCFDACGGKPFRVSVRRWDLAVDLPGERGEFELLKDGRLYEELRRSVSDRTQYLGKRNSPGRCKLYNKTLESNLSVPITRLELTLDGVACGTDDVRSLWPKVLMVPRVVQMDAECLGLNETDRFILHTLWQQPERLAELGRRKRDKLAPLVAAGGMVEFDSAAFLRCLVELGGWLKRRCEYNPPGYGGRWENTE